MIKGVIEGFYGNPWTNNQRLKLFQRMNKMDMNSYLYAPKDDLKHRAEWRLLYEQNERDVLAKLIKSASDNKIEFVYAISPGLDITYSSEGADFKILVEKLEQVLSLGCRSFAILFDDIDNQMKPIDQKCFSSFAHAQTHVTNSLYQHFKDSVKYFFFCPTEYCTKFSIKASKLDIKNENEFKLESSEYLRTIGSSLDANIDILWTGPGIVSVEISIEHIKEVIVVLKRKPLIWENFHANDYDKFRLFLGPLKSRPIELRSYLKGIMTNPNCEFECNFNAIYTLSYWFNWSGSQIDANESEPQMEDVLLEIKKDFKLIDENEADLKSCYNPRLALKESIRNWVEMFYHPTQVSDLNKAKVDNNANNSNENEAQTSELNQSLIKEAKSKAMNSFTFAEDSNNTNTQVALIESNRIDELELKILCDFFYLPYDYGSYSLFVLYMLNSGLKSAQNEKIKCFEYFKLFKDFVLPKFNSLIDKLELIPNKQILHELKEYSRLDELALSLHLSYYFMRLILNSGNLKDLNTSLEFKRTGGLAKEIKRILSVENLKLSNESIQFISLHDIKLVEDKIELIKNYESSFNGLFKTSDDLICFELGSDAKLGLTVTSFINNSIQEQNFLDISLSIPKLRDKSLILVNCKDNHEEFLNKDKSLIISLKLVVVVLISYFKSLNSKGVYLCYDKSLCDLLFQSLGFMEVREFNGNEYLSYDFV